MVRAYSHVCVAKTCYNTRLTHPDKGFFGFPSDPELCEKWLENCQRKDIGLNSVLKSNGYYKLCADHFEVKCFTDSTKTLLRRSLNPVPTIFINNVKSLVPQNSQSSKQVEIDLPATTQPDSEEIDISEYLECVIDPQALLVGSEQPVSFGSIQIVKKRDYGPETISQLLLNLEPQSELYQIQDMCRFCMNKSLRDQDSLDLFSETEQASELRRICQTILPYKVRVWDGLPHKVCEQCASDLQTCHRLMEQFKNADQYLRAIAKYTLYVDLEDDSSSETGSVKIIEEEPCKTIPKGALVMPKKNFNLENISMKITPEDSSNITVANTVNESQETTADVGNVEDLLETSQSEITTETSDKQNEKVELVCENVVFVPSNLPQDDIENFLSYLNSDEKSQDRSSMDDTRLNNNEEMESDMLQLNDEEVEDISEEILRMAERNEEPDLTVSYKCLQCYKVFPSYDSLVDHTLSVHDIPKRRYICKVCSLELDSLGDLQKHTKETHQATIACEHCSEEFSLKVDHTRHMKQNHAFQCSVCEKVWYSQARLDKHYDANHNQRLDCKTCGKVCKSVVARRSHERSHINESHMCWVCGAVLKSRNSMRVHMELHSEKWLACDVCNEQFKTSHALTKHKKLSHFDPNDIDKKIFQCKDCSKVFVCASKLEKHSMCHSEERHHVCEHCGVKFKHTVNLNRHVRRRLTEGACPPATKRKGYKHYVPGQKMKNPRRKEPFLPCTVCGRKFVKEDNVNRHLKFHFCNGDPEVVQKLLDEPEIFDCEICGKVLYSKFSYENHFNRGHNGDTKPFKCEVCDYAASSKNLMILHERNHTGERPFKCHLCDKVFREKKALLKHETVHSEERPHQCTVCDKAFKSRFRLLEHTFVHEDASAIRPFSCPICQRQFTTKRHLNLHSMKVHTEQRLELVTKQIQSAGSDKKFQCQQCGMVFKNQDYRQRHMRRIHRGAKNVRSAQDEPDNQTVYFTDVEDNMAVQYVTIVQSDQVEEPMDMPTLEYIIPHPLD